MRVSTRTKEEAIAAWAERARIERRVLGECEANAESYLAGPGQ